MYIYIMLHFNIINNINIINIILYVGNKLSIKRNNTKLTKNSNYIEKSSPILMILKYVVKTNILNNFLFIHVTAARFQFPRYSQNT